MWSSQLFLNKKINDNVTKFAIGGFGFSGVSLFCQLVNKLILANNENVSYKIEIFEKNKAYFTTGAPYQKNCPHIWTLNNPAHALKLIPNGMDMATWMEKNKNKWGTEFPETDKEYVPRALVGIYLKDQYETYKAMASLHKIHVKEYFEEIIDINHLENKIWRITTGNTNQYHANFLFLCLGHVPSNHYPHLQSKPNYFHSYIDLEQLQRIPKNAPVHFIGGQAAFVDYALLLPYLNHHTGTIYTVTRNVPLITTKGNEGTCENITVDELTTALKKRLPNCLSLTEGKLLFWDTYKEEVKKIFKHPVDVNNPPSTRAALTYQLAKYEGISQDDVQIGDIDALRSYIRKFYFSGCYREFWNKLKEEDKDEFNKQFYSSIIAYVTGITPLNARLLLELYNRDQIRELSGLVNITYDVEIEKFILHFKDGTEQGVEYLIDVSGLGYDISKCNTDVPLLQKIVQKGYLVPKKFGGIQLNDCGQAFNKENQLQENLYCIGPTATYNNEFPTPYAAPFALKAAEQALTTLDEALFIHDDKKENKVFTISST